MRHRGGDLPAGLLLAVVPDEEVARDFLTSDELEAAYDSLGDEAAQALIDRGRDMSIEELRTLVPHVDRDAARLTQKAWIQGLDEGATMISGGEEEMTADNLQLPPTVFCNVEPHMRAARRQEPMPVLCLLRTS